MLLTFAFLTSYIMVSKTSLAIRINLFHRRTYFYLLLRYVFCVFLPREINNWNFPQSVKYLEEKDVHHC